MLSLERSGRNPFLTAGPRECDRAAYSCHSLFELEHLRIPDYPVADLPNRPLTDRRVAATRR